MCGCGIINEVVSKITDYLEILNIWTDNCTSSKPTKICIEQRKNMLNEKFNINSETDEPLLSFMVYILDDKGLIDHGSSISGSYITDLGRVFLYVYKIYLNQENII